HLSRQPDEIEYSVTTFGQSASASCLCRTAPPDARPDGQRCSWLRYHWCRLRGDCSMFVALLRKIFGPSRATCRRDVRRPMFRPTLEGLEGRWVPAILTVGGVGQYTTIAAALTAAQTNDTISVGNGTYTEAITIDKTGIRLVAQSQGNS